MGPDNAPLPRIKDVCEFYRGTMATLRPAYHTPKSKLILEVDV